MKSGAISMRFNWFYFFVGIAFLTMLFVSFRFFRGSTRGFVGVATSKDFTISVEKSAQIMKVAVVPGQQVAEGDLLVEVASPALNIEIDKLTTRVKSLASERLEKSKAIRSQVELIRAELDVKIGELQTDIVQKENESKLNEELVKTVAGQANATNPLKVTIASLKEQKLNLEKARDIQVRDAQMKSETEQLILTNQLQLLQRELDLLLKEQQALSKYATSAGVVENVYVKEGEQVEAYASLIAINPASPTSVTGYLVGNNKDIAVGALVQVSAYERRSQPVEGKVIGFGSVVPLPDILQKSTATKAFGREVFIEIKGNSSLASGERVLIR